MQSKQMKTFNDNADQYEKIVEKIQKLVDKKVIAFITTLDANGGKIKNNPENMRKVLKFQTQLEQIIKAAGYDEVINNFVADVPKLIKAIK